MAGVGFGKSLDFDPGSVALEFAHGRESCRGSGPTACKAANNKFTVKICHENFLSNAKI